MVLLVNDGAGAFNQVIRNYWISGRRLRSPPSFMIIFIGFGPFIFARGSAYRPQNNIFLQTLIQVP